MAFSEKLWGLGRSFDEKCHFWQVHFWLKKIVSFRQFGILPRPLYPKEAWRTVLGPVTAGCATYSMHGGGVGVPGVWGTGSRSITGTTPWYGSGHHPPLHHPVVRVPGRLSEVQWSPVRLSEVQWSPVESSEARWGTSEARWGTSEARWGSVRHQWGSVRHQWGH